MRRDEKSLMQIAITLNASDVPMPADGARWGRQSVKRVLSTRYARDISATMPF
jgi:hypothetical protein